MGRQRQPRRGHSQGIPHLRVVVSLDENVGRVLDYLDHTGLAKSTVVIYTSDNGYFLGEHGFYNKMWMYEESLHLPLPSPRPAGKAGVNDELVGMLDIAPTVLDLAGVKAPSDIQGQSLRPLLRGKTSGWRRAFYYHYYGIPGTPRDDNWIAHHEIFGIRTKTAKLVCYPTWKGGPFWEFFDLARDPREMSNRFNDPSEQKTVTEMKQRLRTLAEQYQDVDAVRTLDEIMRVSSKAHGRRGMGRPSGE